ncbi:MAG: hypothetical protein IT359_06750 [Gemmatimonadaceae bacterium]|nr:hypothetical protein [Gemmatimonadaceae bacterium]
MRVVRVVRAFVPKLVTTLAAALILAPTAQAQHADSARAGVKPKGDSARVVTPATTAEPTPAAPSRRRATAMRDSLSPPVSPGRAFLLSLAVPGLGQSRLNRPTAGAVYFTSEAVWLAMLGKAANDLRIAKAHARDVIVNTYDVDATTGAPKVDGDGNYVVKDTLRSKYADPLESSGVGEQQQRSRVKARRLHFEDWIAMLLFNHLFSAADAFVSSQLWDLPAQVEMRALPRGVGIGFTLPFR